MEALRTRQDKIRFALIRGEPNRQKIPLTVLADKVREII